MSVVFVTGTDTGVGKTVVTAALAAGALASGRSVCVVKPAQTGVAAGDPGDVEEVRRLAGRVATREVVRLPDPLAPATAARVAGVALPPLGTHIGVVRAATADHDVVLVEGSGGVLVHLGDFTLLDLAVGVADPDASVVVVARAGLGTLNHAALTVGAVRDRGIRVAGVVIGSWPADPGLAEVCNLDDIPAYTGAALLGRLPEKATTLEPVEFRRVAPTWIELC